MPAPVRVTNVKEESFIFQKEFLVLPWRRLQFQKFGGAIHYSVMVQLSSPQHSPACPFTKMPYKHLFISAQDLISPGSPTSAHLE